MSLPTEALAMIKSYLELTPGVDATRANLKTLLAYTLRCGYYRNEVDLSVEITPQSRRKPKTLVARLQGPQTCRRSPPCGPVGFCSWCSRSTLRVHEFPADEDGLLQALVSLKTAVKKYREEGVCKLCKTPHFVCLKADGMPHCERCVLGAALGL